MDHFPSGRLVYFLSGARIHHIHLVPGDPNQFADYYARLFVARQVERGEFWGHPGVRDARSVLLFSPGANDRRGARAVVWQMGWGKVSLGQSYRQHYAQEVDWAPPYASLSAELHLHVRTRDARLAAEWYRDVLGGSIEVSRDIDAAQEGMTTAIVRFDGLTLALHVTSESIAPSRDAGTVDHVAFAVDAFSDLSIGSSVQAPGAPYTLRSKRTAFVTAPDGLRIELVEDK
ncbi:VOC family protein [Luteitalea sp.]|uniref:VOC family protein n=1 Tax=Luteitalea sp. TaxID=2004800 RepID=UPI0025BCF4F2|nr:VOC family protein [Luteitalea sp.]